MPETVLYFIPTTSAETSPLPELINRLTVHFSPSVLPNWSLRQRLFRSTQAPSANATTTNGQVKPSQPRYLQMVSLPEHPQESFVTISPIDLPTTKEGTPTDSKAVIVSIPSGPSTDDFAQLLVSKLGPLWQPRQLLAVTDGQAYETGGLRTRIGEIKQGAAGAQLVRGVIVEVSYVGQDTALLGKSSVETIISGFWEQLGVNEAKPYFRPDSGEKADGFEDVRLWCRALLLKS